MQGRRWLVTFAARGQCRAASRERVGHGSHGRAGRAGLPPATSRQRGRASTLSLNPERGGGFSGTGCGPLYCDLRAPRDSGLGRSCARASLRVSKSSTCLMCARPHTTTQAAFSPHAIMDAAPPHTERQELAARETAGGGARHTHTLRPSRSPPNRKCCSPPRDCGRHRRQSGVARGASHRVHHRRTDLVPREHVAREGEEELRALERNRTS